MFIEYVNIASDILFKIGIGGTLIVLILALLFFIGVGSLRKTVRGLSGLFIFIWSAFIISNFILIFKGPS